MEITSAGIAVVLVLIGWIGSGLITIVISRETDKHQNKEIEDIKKQIKTIEISIAMKENRLIKVEIIQENLSKDLSRDIRDIIFEALDKFSNEKK